MHGRRLLQQINPASAPPLGRQLVVLGMVSLVLMRGGPIIAARDWRQFGQSVFMG